MKSTVSEIIYQTQVEKIKLTNNLEIEVEMISDLDTAIDQICDLLEKSGRSTDAFAEDLCPYFGILWPSAVALATELSRMGGFLKGKSVLELGAGLALPSLVAAKLGAEVTTSDFHPDVRIFLEANSSRNGVHTRYVETNWTQAESFEGKKFDYVIASDVLYEKNHPETLAKALDQLCSKTGHIILADPGRSYLQGFTQALESLGYHSDLFVREAYGFDRSGKRDQKQVFILYFQKK